MSQINGTLSRKANGVLRRRSAPTLPTGLFTDSGWRQVSGDYRLTPRQDEVARLMCEGLTYKSIAVRTGISINTVRMHMRALFMKVGVHDRVGLILHLIAAERGLGELRGATRSDS
jgi:DNA-binding CsgD family transcriptional regulator